MVNKFYTLPWYLRNVQFNIIIRSMSVYRFAKWFIPLGVSEKILHPILITVMRPTWIILVTRRSTTCGIFIAHWKNTYVCLFEITTVHVSV
jgi:hypothetical protein